ncbi:MAG: cyclic nucleotide-binding domain-containing protein, partial [Anaerolineae bacterium]|nr:cyclic nucleotide-binding domain-containing protein [Anaerolineae bacterium]
MSCTASPQVSLLRRVPYFSRLADEVLIALAAVAVERRYERGQVIFLEGEPCAGLHLVVHGQVKIYKLSPQGREQILHQGGPGETFNDVAALDGGPN